MLALACAGSAGAAAATTGAAALVDENCIVGENAFGCLSRSALADITRLVGDPAELRAAIDARIQSGMCRLFDYGERVYVTASDARGDDHKAVRRPGDPASYWMPASWSRPAHDCRSDASSASLRRKIGMDSNVSAGLVADPAGDAYGVGSAYGRPALEHRSARARCVFKPVMSDVEIAACRSAMR